MEKSKVIECLSALAHDSRLDIVRFLVRKGLEGAPAGQIAENFGLPSATLTFHLNALTAAGVLKRSRSGRQIIYFADISTVHNLTAFLLENCCSESEIQKSEKSSKHHAA